MENRGRVLLAVGIAMAFALVYTMITVSNAVVMVKTIAAAWGVIAVVGWLFYFLSPESARVAPDQSREGRRHKPPPFGGPLDQIFLSISDRCLNSAMGPPYGIGATQPRLRADRAGCHHIFRSAIARNR
jgi:hypothetical protein